MLAPRLTTLKSSPSSYARHPLPGFFCAWVLEYGVLYIRVVVLTDARLVCYVTSLLRKPR